MKGEMQVNTYTDAPCKEFVAHRFKKSHCSQCFKPKSQHILEQKETAIVTEKINKNVQLIQIKSTYGIENRNPAIRNEPIKRTYVSARRFEDGVLDKTKLSGKTKLLRKQFESQDSNITNRTAMSRDNKNQNGAVLNSPDVETQDNGFIMTIPVEPSFVKLNDLNSNSNHNGAINDHYQSASDDEILSEPSSPSRFWRTKWSPKPTRAMDLIPSGSIDDDTEDQPTEMNDAGSGLLISSPRQAWQLNNERPTSNGLQEFQKIAKRLRHIDPPPDSPKLERKPLKSQSPNTSPKSDENKLVANDLEGKQTSECPTLSLGGRSQDKCDIVPTTVAQETNNSGSGITKSSPTKQPPVKAKKSWKKPDSPGPIDKSKLDLGSKPVTIKFRDGRVAHYDGSSKTPAQMTSSESEDKVDSMDVKQRPPAATKAYVVVDVSKEPPKGLSTSDRRSISNPPLPCTPPPRSRPASQISNSSADSVSPSKYPMNIDGLPDLNRSNSIDSALTESTESDMSPVKHSSISANPPVSLAIDSKRNTPPYPIILQNQESYEPPQPPVRDRRSRSERRPSAGYRVPIFIQPQNYDNLGTAKSDSETKLNELPEEKKVSPETPPTPPFRTASQDYLVPMRDSVGSNISGELEASMSSGGNRDSGSFSASDSESKSPQKQTASEDFRNRAQSHPPEKPEPVYAKISHKPGWKSKRTAPGPPQSDLDYTDTMPRSPPPPPPPISKMNKHKRGSSEIATPVSKVEKSKHKRGSSEAATPVSRVTKQKSDSSREVLVVDLSQPIAKKQAENIYSSAPHRKPDSYEKVLHHDNFKPIVPAYTPERGMSQNKAPAPSRPLPSEPSAKVSVSKPLETSSPKPMSQSLKERTPEVNRVASPVRPLPSEPSAKVTVSKPLETNSPKPMSQSLKERTPEVSRVASPVRNSVPARTTKDPSPTKGKAPVPIQRVAPSSGVLSPVRNRLQSVKQDKPPSSQLKQAQSPPASRAKSPLETDVPLQNGRASPTKRVDIQAKIESSDEAAGSPPAKTIAPLPPNSPLNGRRLISGLPDDTITGGPSPNKPKNKVKLLWKKRHKRKDDGSPEREFNAEPVQKWLDEIQKMQNEDKSNRHSLDRLDVINAYKGQPTATIHDSGPLPPLTKVLEHDDETDGPRSRNNSAVKRQAPKPPGEDGEKQEDQEEISPLQKSYSASPMTRRRYGSNGDNGNFYENVGIQRKEDAPPSKPTRRVRNRTTGFEDLPSQKRMAPKVPDEDGKAPLCRKQSLSDQDLRKIGIDDHPIPPPRTRRQSDVSGSPRSRRQSDATDSPRTRSYSHGSELTKSSRSSSDATDSSTDIPLKSAMRRSSEGSKKFDQDGKPRRPVRIIAPKSPDTNINDLEDDQTTIFDNLEYLLMTDLELDKKAKMDSFYGNADSDESSSAVSSPSADASVQCSLPGRGVNIVFDAVIQMNSKTLASVGSCSPEQTVWWTEETVWSDLMDGEPCFCTKDAAFYQASDAEQPHNSVIIMVPLNANVSSNILQVAEFTRHVTSHPNLFNIHDVCVESVCNKESNQPSESVESVDPTLVVLDKLPAVSLWDYVIQNAELHHTEPEKYELDIVLLLLQLCSAVNHLGQHRVALQTIKIENVHLMQNNGSGLKLILNHLLSELHYASSKDGKILTTEEQIQQRTGEFSLGILVYEMLHLANPFTTKPNLITQDYAVSDLPAIPLRSKYSRFLNHLATGLLTKHSTDRLTVHQCMSALQTLLWGPQVDNLPLDTQDPKVLEQILEQWLVLEQTKMVNKVAMQKSTQRKGVFGLREQMQCLFLSKASVVSLKEGLTCLYLRKR